MNHPSLVLANGHLLEDMNNIQVRVKYREQLQHEHKF